MTKSLHLSSLQAVRKAGSFVFEIGLTVFVFNFMHDSGGNLILQCFFPRPGLTKMCNRPKPGTIPLEVPRLNCLRVDGSVGAMVRFVQSPFV